MALITSDCAALQGGVVVTAPVRVVGSTLRVSAAPPPSSLHNRRLRQSGEDFSCRSRVALALLDVKGPFSFQRESDNFVLHLSPRPARSRWTAGPPASRSGWSTRSAPKTSRAWRTATRSSAKSSTVRPAQLTPARPRAPVHLCSLPAWSLLASWLAVGTRVGFLRSMCAPGS